MITKQMRMYEILEDDRMCAVLLAHGLNCQGCPGALSETLEEAAKGHNIDFLKLLEDLNAIVEE
jgi:hybrid cluster-associated redox disulfide protein